MAHVNKKFNPTGRTPSLEHWLEQHQKSPTNLHARRNPTTAAAQIGIWFCLSPCSSTQTNVRPCQQLEASCDTAYGGVKYTIHHRTCTPYSPWFSYLRIHKLRSSNTYHRFIGGHRSTYSPVFAGVAYRGTHLSAPPPLQRLIFSKKN
jgi:hypothetical protein